MPDRVEMTPGPTIVPEAVRRRMAEPTPNPDMDPAFLPFYRELLERLATLFDTDHDVVVLGGEGILGLEASIASLIEPDDPVLCISNGLYGDGFADFVELYGGEPTLCGGPDDRPIDVDRVEEHLASETFVAATMVHCETPTGVLNDLEPVLERCADDGVLTILDAVSLVGGTSAPVDDTDACILGSQKCLSLPPGLTMPAASAAARFRAESLPQRSFHTCF
jgi:aspartate aminotransferase-like enzyme